MSHAERVPPASTDGGATLSPLKLRRYRRCIAKKMGLHPDASAAQILEALDRGLQARRALLPDDKAGLYVRHMAREILAGNADMAATRDWATATRQHGVPVALAEAARAAPVSLSEPLEALRAKG